MFTSSPPPPPVRGLRNQVMAALVFTSTRQGLSAEGERRIPGFHAALVDASHSIALRIEVDRQTRRWPS
jgi:hypothetical protein